MPVCVLRIFFYFTVSPPLLLSNLHHFLQFALLQFQVYSLWLAAFFHANPLISDGNIVFDLRPFYLTLRFFVRIATGA